MRKITMLGVAVSVLVAGLAAATLTQTPATWPMISVGWVGLTSRSAFSLMTPTVAGVSLTSCPSRVAVTVTSPSAVASA